MRQTEKLDNFGERSVGNDGSIANINDSLAKMDILLNKASSPIVSNLKASNKYTTQKLPETLDEYRAAVKGGVILSQPVDLNKMINDHSDLQRT